MAQFTPHPVFDRVFSPGRLSLGLVLPMGRVGEIQPDPREQLELARLADALGFAALWVRDVPINSPDYPDPVAHLDPWTQLAALAVVTQSIALVTGAIVAPLRHPLHVAKAALSIDRLSAGRMILGLGSGDRPSEFQAFGLDVSQAPERLRQAWATIEGLVGDNALIDPAGVGADPAATLLPRPVHGRVPILAVGSAGQTIGWVARNANGWATYYRPLAKQKDRFGLWAAAVEKAQPSGAPAFASAMVLALLADPNAPAEPLGLGLRTGRNALIAELSALRDLGAHHVMFSLVRTDRNLDEVLGELAQEVLPRL
uniref:Luciferase family protein n=1 Tax=Caulobacter sp. (strain K31) TaxID=366602 RepID=B0T921_CAUSK